MIVTLLAPYDTSETTAAALYLAEYLKTRGYQVRYIATTTVRTRVDPFWDNRVLYDQFTTTLLETCYVGAVIQFGLSQRLRRVVSINNTVQEKQIPHILVCSEPVPPETDADYLKAHTKIVCTTQRTFDSLARVLGKAKNKRCLAYWDTGERFRVRSATCVKNTTRACFVCDSNVIECTGSFTLRLIHEALQTYDHLYIEVASMKQWARADHRVLQKLKAQYGERLVTNRLASYRDFVRRCNQNDWIVNTAVSGTFMLPVLTALARGNPVICNHVDPYRYAVLPDNGITVLCEYYQGTGQCEIAYPSYAGWCAAMRDAFTYPDNLIRWCRTHANRTGMRNIYRNMWDTILL